MTTPNGTTQPLVRVGQPTIQTLSVTVHALRIGPKQVTQSVFRQLPERSVWDAMTGELQGTPWGHVNYYWGACTPDHLHVVWDDGEQLYRDCVWGPRDRTPAGLVQAGTTARLARERLAIATRHVCALDVLDQGWDLSARAWDALLTVSWDTGVRSTYDWEKAGSTTSWDSAGWNAVASHLMHFMEAQTERALAYRETTEGEPEAVEVSRGQHSLFGVRPGPPEVVMRPTRIRETEEAWRIRYRAEMATMEADLRQALSAEMGKEWSLDTIPQTAGAALAALVPIAQAVAQAESAYDLLSVHFLHTYEQITAGPQLFIAV